MENMNCTMDQIYVDTPYKDKPDKSLLNDSQARTANLSNYVSEFQNSYRNKCKSFQQKQLEVDNCFLCNHQLCLGENVYYCNCKNFYHPNCIAQQLENFNSQKCCNCGGLFTFGIYKLTSFPSSLNNTADNAKTTYAVNPNNSTANCDCSTLDQTFQKDTNINRVENYEQVCKVASFIKSPENVIGYIQTGEFNANSLNSNGNEENYEANNSAQAPNKNLNYNNNSFINVSNINNYYFSPNYVSQQNESNNNSLNRIALSPINFTGSPYEGTYVGNTTAAIAKNLNNQMGNFNQSSYEERFAGVRQHLNFNNLPVLCQDQIAELQKSKAKTYYNEDSFKDKNNVLSKTNLFDLFDIQVAQSNQYHIISKYRKLSFGNIDNERGILINDNFNNFSEDDKENHPPLPVENSRCFNGLHEDNNKKFAYEPNEVCGENQENEQQPFNISNDILDVNIEAGLSHINSDTPKVVEVPISIDVQISNMAKALGNFSLCKDTYIIFNTRELNEQTKFEIFKYVYTKMSQLDRISSNILKTDKFLNKEELYKILSKPANFLGVIQNTNVVDHRSLIQVISYAINNSLKENCNSYNLLIISDMNSVDVNDDYTGLLKELLNKLQETKVNLQKQFTINSIILDDVPKDKSDANVNFVKFLYDLSMLCFGYFYSSRNFNELMKSINLFFTALNEQSILNTKLIIKLNKDPAIVFENLNYPCAKLGHNSYEIYLGPIMLKEKKRYNFTTKIIMNNCNISLSLPILEVAVEYLISKNTLKDFSFTGKISTSSHNSITCPSNIGAFSFGNEKNANFNNYSNLIRNRTVFYNLSIPILNRFKSVSISNTVFFKNIISKTTDNIAEAVKLLLKAKYLEAFNLFMETKTNFENSLKYDTSIYLDFAEITQKNIQNITINNFGRSSQDGFFTSPIADNSFAGDDLNIMLNMVKMVFNDLNWLIQCTRSANCDQVGRILTITESLLYNRALIFEDERFIDDLYANFNEININY